MTAQPQAAPIAHLAGLIGRREDRGGLAPGDRAELRRMEPRDGLPPAAWRLLVTLDLHREDEERAWAMLIRTMLEAGPAGSQPRPVGSVLARPADETREYAEPRFIRLLRARGLPEVMHEARQAARWCAAHGGGVAFTEKPNGFVWFLLSAALHHDRDAERCAHAIARDYFRTPRPAKSAQES